MTLTRRHYLALFSAGLSAAPTLEETWRAIAKDTDGTVGAAALHLESGRRASLNATDHYPLASVCKLPIALHIFAMVDEGKLARDAQIEVLPQDIVRNVSEAAQRWPRQKRFPLDQLIGWMIAQSDNTAVETFYRIGGGGAAITARLRAWHIDGIRIDRTERQCNRDNAADMPRFIADPRDSATPESTVDLLRRLYRGELLSAPSTTRIIQIMESTTTGAGRIKGQLPAGTVVAHKTGTTGSVKGLSGGTNDVGVITLPKNAGRLALAIYIKGSMRGLDPTEAVIARIAKAAYDWAAPAPMPSANR